MNCLETRIKYILFGRAFVVIHDHPFRRWLGLTGPNNSTSLVVFRGGPFFDHSFAGSAVTLHAGVRGIQSVDQRNVQKTASSLPFDLDLFFPDYVGNLHVNITTPPSRGDNLFLVLGII